MDITNATITLSNHAGGKYTVRMNSHGGNTAGGGSISTTALLDDGTIIDTAERYTEGTYFDQDCQNVGDLDGSVLKCQLKTSSSSSYWGRTPTSANSTLLTLEVW